MKRLFLAVFAMLMVVGGQLNAQDLNAPINPDPNVRVGKLENGMAYYLRNNGKPEKRVEFRLAVNAGSNQENEDQLGLAHFTEHMAFNGIEGFPGNSVVEELQKIGVSFGRDLNAYTSFDETVYMIKIPSDNPKYVDMGVDILYGWAHGLLFDHQEIDDERGVITEEYRMGLGADDRQRKKWFPVVMSNSRYAERDPIGTLDIIQNFEYQKIKDFYKDWYRPDLQAVIIVGDINVDEMERKVKEKFGKISPLQNPREKIDYPIGNNTRNLAVVATDKEAMGNQVLLIRKYPHFAMKTVGDFKKHLSHELYNLMYASRLSEMAQDPKSPFIGASTGYGKLIGSVDTYMSQATSKENRIDETIEALMREDYRVLQYGFLDTELKRAKEELLNQYETAAKETDKTESAVFASAYINNYLHHDPIPGAKREFNLAKRHLESITLDEINALAKQWITPNNMVAVVMAPEKAGVKVPTESQILAIINNKELANVTPYVDTYKEQEVVDRSALRPGTIVSARELSEIGTKEVTLSNGIKVYLKKTDFKNDEILFAARSKGGSSLYPESDLSSAAFASDMVDRAGIGELNYSSLEKKMKGKMVGLVPYINALSEGFTGSSAPKDLDFFFQYLHAFFTAPRHDAAVYDLVIDETLEQIKMLQANPMYQFFGEFLDDISQKDPYQASGLTYTEEFIRSADYEKAFQIYKQRFANPADFTYFFVGNFDEAEMDEYLKTYLASLPTSTQKENFRGEVLKSFPPQKSEKTMYAGMDEQSWVGMAFSKPYPWNEKNNMIIRQIGDALDIEVLETIREKMGGVYSPMLQMGYDKFPNSAYVLMVMFSCSPDNTDKLSNAVLDLLKTFQKTGPKPETLVKVKEQLIRANQSDLQKNSAWRSYLSGKDFYGDDMNSITTYEERVNAVTNEEIVNFMKTYFDADHYLKLYLYPESMKK